MANHNGSWNGGLSRLGLGSTTLKIFGVTVTIGTIIFHIGRQVVTKNDLEKVMKDTKKDLKKEIKDTKEDLEKEIKLKATADDMRKMKEDMKEDFGKVNRSLEDILKKL